MKYDADRHSWTKEELRAYDNASIAEGDLIQREKFLVDKGKKEGMKENTYKVVKKCLEKNMDAENIADIVDVTIEEVLEIINEIKN